MQTVPGRLSVPEAFAQLGQLLRCEVVGPRTPHPETLAEFSVLTLLKDPDATRCKDMEITVSRENGPGDTWRIAFVFRRHDPPRDPEQLAEFLRSAMLEGARLLEGAAIQTPST